MALSIQPVVLQPYAETSRFQPGREASSEAGRESAASAAAPESGGKPAAQAQAQTAQEKKVVDALKARDREVRAHEQAHVAAAGGLALGGPSYTYQYGPDGIAYAIGGEVNIDTSPGRTPEETIDKAKQIRAAALAPADPSDQDRAVAAAAAQLEAQAQQELAQRAAQESSPNTAAPNQPNPGEENATAPSSATNENEQARQNAALYGVIAAATTPGSIINVAA